MRFIDADAIAKHLSPAQLTRALACMFRDGCETPVRQQHAIEVPGRAAGTLLLMPAWRTGGYLGIKLVTVFPGNSTPGIPSVAASYLLMDATTGQPLAMLDGEELTARRTAATSALAARFLARENAATHLVIGTGRIAEALARTYHALWPSLTRHLIWGRNPRHARRLVDALSQSGIPAEQAATLPDAVTSADIVSAATLSTDPLIQGDWVRPGTHVDLVGGFTPTMREADDALIRKSRVYADTRAGALTEAGDLVIPIARGLLEATHVADLHDLCRELAPGRETDTQITLFKSVGAALEDLAAAVEVYERTTAPTDHRSSAPRITPDGSA